MKFRTLALAGLFLGIGTTLTMARTYEKVFEHAFIADKFEKTEFDIARGDVSMSSTDGSSVTVVIKMTIEARSQESADKAFDQYKIEFTEDEGVAKAVLKEEKSRWSWMLFWRADPVIKVGVQVPNGVNLKLASGAGDVQMADIDARLSIASGAGDVQGRNLKGNLSLATGAGDVILSDFEGKMNVATGAGDLEANGNISSFEIATGKGDASIVVTNSDIGSCSIATGMGDIDLTLPGNTAFEIASEVGFGDITCEFEVDAIKQEKKELRGTVNGGGPRVSMAGGFGDITIRAGRITE